LNHSIKITCTQGRNSGISLVLHRMWILPTGRNLYRRHAHYYLATTSFADIAKHCPPLPCRVPSDKACGGLRSRH